MVLCYPGGQEYIRSRRAFRQLAIRLSSAGFPVLRFDYHGCGDSSGDDDEGKISQSDQICSYLAAFNTKIVAR